MKLKNLLAISMSAVLAMTALTACGSKDDSSEAASESASSSKKTAKVIEIDLTDEQYAFGVDKDQPELLTQVNDFIKSMNEDGSFEEICNHYFGDGEPVAVESATLDANKDQLGSRRQAWQGARYPEHGFRCCMSLSWSAQV